MGNRRVFLAVISATILLPSAPASAATLAPLAPNSSWGSAPIAAASPPGDQSRVFIVERSGGVRIVEDGELRTTPFLTVPNVDTSGDSGLLSIAFAPDYSTSGLFYVYTVAAGADALDPSALPGEMRIVEYRRSESDPDLADPASARLVLEQPHGGAIHYGGQLAFGPEGLLYVTTGDAGTGANAQSLANDLGKVLRIDPREQSGGAPFGVPPSNPFVATAGARPEIYALGLRNPFRASFAPNGDLVLPDVGQATWEEVNVGRATATPPATTLAGANLGWPTCEAACSPPNASYVDPIFQYLHGSTETTGCAIIGGYVVRDPALEGLTGRYLYGDYCRQDLRTLDLGEEGADPRPAGVSIPAGGGALLGFGEDGRGCLYVMTDVTAYRVAEWPASGRACPARGTPSPDSTPPRLSLAGRRQRLHRFLRVFATCDEACSLHAAGNLRLPGAKASASVGLIGATGPGTAGQRTRLGLKLRRRAFTRVGRALRRGSKVIARVTVTATDPSGNVSRSGLRVELISPSPRGPAGRPSAMLSP
jgi:hypothetical protein